MLLNNPQSTDKKTYAVLPSNLMRIFGEICGYNDLDEEVYQIIAEDATFRLNEILNQSENLRKRINKEKLDVNEINRMLKCSNVKEIEGSDNKDKIISIFDDKEEPINLINESEKLVNEKQYARLRSTKIHSEYVKLKYLNEPTQLTNLSEGLKNYLNFLTKNLFTSNDKLFDRILNDLLTNDQLSDLIFHLIGYLDQNLDSIVRNEFKSTKLILIVESLVKNKNLEFKLQHFLIQLIDLSLNCLINDTLEYELDFLFKFRHCSAKLLKLIVFKFHFVINQNKILTKILDLLLDKFIRSTNLDIKYGIMIFFQNLNPFIYFEILFPFLIQFVQSLEIKFIEKTIQPEEKQLFMFSLISLVSCFNYVINSERILNLDKFDVNQLYLRIYNVYGDSFTNLIQSND